MFPAQRVRCHPEETLQRIFDGQRRLALRYELGPTKLPFDQVFAVACPAVGELGLDDDLEGIAVQLLVPIIPESVWEEDDRVCCSMVILAGSKR